MTEADTRALLVELAASLFARGFSVGSAGNISVRLHDGGYLVTPTNSSLGRLDPMRLSRLDASFAHAGGDKPSKEVSMHRAFYRARPQTGAVVHLHSTHGDGAGVPPRRRRTCPPLTPYFVMRIGGVLPLVPYYRPGDPAMEPAIAQAALGARAVLLANHGPVVSGPTLTDAVYAAEELEEAAKLALLLRGLSPRTLSPEQVAELLATFG